MMSQELIERISAARGVSTIIYPSDAVLFQQGENSADAYLICEGLVKLVRADAGGRQIIVALRPRGSFIGVPALILGVSQPTTAITVSKCHLLRIPAEVFPSIFENDSRAAWELHKIQCRVSLDACERISELACQDSSLRLLHLLKQVARLTGNVNNRGEIKVLLPLKRREIAELIAVTPEHLSRLFRQLERKGLIRVQKGWVLLSPSLLSNGFADGHGQMKRPVRLGARLHGENVPDVQIRDAV